MCGILGTTNTDILPEVLERSLREIHRRGPDNKAFTDNGTVIFGHTRLSILDLDERSNQPFVYEHEGQKILLTFNGEIYNFKEIKNILVQDYKYIFKTSSDTEVIAAAYLKWGLSCFDFFMGMWALAISDGEKLIFSRDRTGKKPFYYTVSKHGNIFFSSSLRAVSILSEKSEISAKGLELYFALGFLPKNHTIYDDIYKLEPGRIEVYAKENGKYMLETERRSEHKNFKGYTEKSVKQTLKDAVKRRTVSDVPIATLMSGGVDSTIVTKLTSFFNSSLESFFVDFDDKALSEHKWASYLSKRNQIQLTKVLMEDADLMKSFEDYYEAYEEPFADYSGIPSIAIFKKVSKKYKVVLTGDGGDELFYGYSHYSKKVLLFKLFPIIRIFRNSGWLPKSIQNIVSSDRENFESNYLRNHGILTPFASQLINCAFNGQIKKYGSFSKAIIGYDREFYNWPEKYLVKVDRASMFSSVEVRSPFMDENLLKRVLKIPTFFLFTPFASKLFLKLKYYKLFGFGYFFAKKKGFTPPIAYLRKTFFNKIDFEKTKSFIGIQSVDLATEMTDLTFDNLKKDDILFDRFFFFHEWLKRENRLP